MHLDELQDALYVLDGVNVQKFDAGAAKTATFKSKLFHQPAPTVGFACAEVVGSQSSGSPVSFTLHVMNMDEGEAAKLAAVNSLFVATSDTSVKYSVAVTNSKPFRLPGGYRAQDFQIEVSTTTSIQGVAVAHSMKDLAQT